MKTNESILESNLTSNRNIPFKDIYLLKENVLEAMKEAQIEVLDEVIDKMEELEFPRHYTDIKEILEQFKKELK